MRRLILPSLLFVLACSSEDSSSETPSSFCEKWASGACSDRVVLVCQAADVDDCKASQFAFCLDLIPAEGFSGEQAGPCLDAVSSAYSDADLSESELKTVLRLAAPCDQLVRGPRAEGGVCSSRLDCNAPDGYDCVFKAAATTGTCQIAEVVSPGLGCSAANATCSEGFYCNGNNCIVGQEPGGACATDRECGTDAFCSSGLCAARLGVESPCTFDAQCESGLCYQVTPSAKVCTSLVRLSINEPICDDLS